MYKRQRGNFVGYYGGGATSANAGTTLSPSVTITNGEKLTATISATLPMPLNADIGFLVTLTDNYGNSTKAYYCTAEEASLYSNPAGIPVHAADLTGKCSGASNATFTKQGIYYELKLTLDSLESDGSLRFTKLYGSQSPAAEAGAPLPCTRWLRALTSALRCRQFASAALWWEAATMAGEATSSSTAS